MSDPIIKYREYKGITVGDVNDIITYVNGMSSSPIGAYVVNVGKQGDVYFALNSDGEQITWTAGGGGGSDILDYVESIQPHDYSITYMFYEKGIWKQNEIYFASINGTSVIGKNDITLVTPLQLSEALDGKQDLLSDDQQSAVDSSITYQKVIKYDEYEDQINNKQPKLPTYVNDKYLKVVNGALSWEDAGGSGGSKYYLHTVSFNTNRDDMHFQIGVITKNSAIYENLNAFWNDITRIVTIFGTPNVASETKEIYFNGALADNNTIFVRGIDNEFEVVTKNISKMDVDEQSFGDYGVEEL